MPAGEIDADRNPLVGFQNITKAISREYPGVGDISDKWHEAGFLKAVAPKMAPETRLGNDEKFAVNAPDPAAVEEITRSVREVMQKYSVAEDPKLLQDTIHLELLRRHIETLQGKSILKIRGASHSEGHLPKTNDNWIETYIVYMTQTKPKMEAIEKEIAGTSESLASRIVDLPMIEGLTLERVLQQPTDVVVQKMIKSKKEVRIHVVNGEIIEGATFLRFYEPGEYLEPGEIHAIHSALRHDFLDNLRGDVKKFSATMDVIVDSEGHYYCIDLNAGLSSGYYYPEEDLFTTALFARYFTGKNPEILREFEEFATEPLGPRKVELLKAMLAKYEGFMKGDVLEAFWDRVLFNYREILSESKTGKRLSEILGEFRDAGLREILIYDEFLADVQTTWPQIRLPEKEAQFWLGFTTAGDPEHNHYLDGMSHLRVRKLAPHIKHPAIVAAERRRTGKRQRATHLPWGGAVGDCATAFKAIQ